MNSFAIRALLPLTRMTWLEILALARAVYAGMNGNSAFPHPPVAIAVFRAAIDDFEASLVDAEDRGAKAIARRNVLGQELMKMLRQFAFYVEAHCGNDINVLLSSGFAAVTTVRRAAEPLSQSIRRIDATSTSGQLRVTIMSITEAFSYELRWTPAAGPGETPAPWTVQPVVKSRPPALITGLTPGATYVFQLRALTDSGFTDWSDSVSRMAT